MGIVLRMFDKNKWYRFAELQPQRTASAFIWDDWHQVDVWGYDASQKAYLVHGVRKSKKGAKSQEIIVNESNVALDRILSE